MPLHVTPDANLIRVDRWTTSLSRAYPMPSDYTPHHVGDRRSHPYAKTHAASKLDVDNYPEPGKRPLSSTAPTIMEDGHGEFFAAIGGSGGSKIFPAVFQTLINLDWGLDASAAVEYGRVHDQLFPTHVEADNVYPADILHDLRSKGHNVTGMCFASVGRAYEALTFSCDSHGYWSCSGRYTAGHEAGKLHLR